MYRAHRPVMLDILGTELSFDDQRRLLHRQTGGVILFARNFVTRTQLLELTHSLRVLRPDILIAVDHEGGRVQRFKSDGFTHLPAMRVLGQMWDQDPQHGAIHATQCATAVGYVLAAELRACDIDFSFTPVLDLDYGVSQVIGNRAFHHDARVVTLLAKSLTQGLMLAGMANCAKHFPGHGYVLADSHHAIPVDERALHEILADDAAPYAWMGGALSAVMPAHVIYSQVDSLAAGFSSYWLQTILRERLVFSGAIFSDDLSMHGASALGSIVERGQAALRAGCDMVLVCNAPDSADELLAGLDAAANHQSAQRLRALRLANPFASWQALQHDARYQQALNLLRSAQLIVE